MKNYDFNIELANALSAAFCLGSAIMDFKYAKDLTKQEIFERQQGIIEAEYVIDKLSRIPQKYSYGIYSVFVDVSNDKLKISDVQQVKLLNSTLTEIQTQEMITIGIKLFVASKLGHNMKRVVDKIRKSMNNSYTIKKPII